MPGAPRWTERELSLLAFYWGEDVCRTAKRLGRTPRAVLAKAGELRLRSTRSRVRTVAREAGIDPEALVSLCARHKIQIKRSPSLAARPDRAGRAYHHGYVDRDRVMEALAADLHCETAFAAAARLGRHGTWVVRRLKAAGVWRKGWWVKYPSAVIDAAIAAYRPSATDRAGRSPSCVSPPHNPTTTSGPAEVSP